MPKTIEARRALYRPLGANWVRITPDGCVLDVDMAKIKGTRSHVKRILVSCGQEKLKTFCRLELDGELWLADVITGTLYNGATGKHATSQQLYIKNP